MCIGNFATVSLSESSFLVKLRKQIWSIIYNL